MATTMSAGGLWPHDALVHLSFMTLDSRKEKSDWSSWRQRFQPLPSDRAGTVKADTLHGTIMFFVLFDFQKKHSLMFLLK